MLRTYRHAPERRQEIDEPTQERILKTAIPGPKSVELQEQRDANFNDALFDLVKEYVQVRAVRNQRQGRSLRWEQIGYTSTKWSPRQKWSTDITSAKALTSNDAAAGSV